MATALELQVPKIIDISAGTIRVAHPDIGGNISSSLAAPIAAAATAMTVYDNNGFADNDFLLVGSPDNRESEEIDINGVVTRGQGLTVTNTLKFGHTLDTPVTKITARAIKIYGAATDGGAGTLIASINAVTTPIADAVMIQWDKPYTEWTLISTDTAYAFYYAVFTDGTTDGSASVYVPSTGLAYTKLEPLIKQALDLTNAKIDNKRLTSPMYVNWANDCQDDISQFVYQDPGSGRFIQKDWSYEVVVDQSIVLVEGQDSYELSDLASTIKYPNSDKAVLSVQIGTARPMRKMAIKDFDIFRRDVSKTLTNGSTAIGAITMTVDSTANLATSGSLQIGSQTITYTGKTTTTFTGIPASGSGSVTAIIADNTPVWQNMQSGQPRGWVPFGGSILLDIPPSSTYAGKTIQIRYLKSIPRITSVSDGTEIPFTNVMRDYLVAMTFYRLGQTDLGEKWMQTFRKGVTANAIADYIPVLDEWRYYNFIDEVYSETTYDDGTYYNY